MHSPIPEKWRDHTWAKVDKIAYAHVDFLLPLSNPNWKNQTDLPDGTMVDLKTLWSHMCEDGMFVPLVVRLGMTDHTIRLETGNQRIRLFADHGVEYVPIVCEMAVDSSCPEHCSDFSPPVGLEGQ